MTIHEFRDRKSFESFFTLTAEVKTTGIMGGDAGHGGVTQVELHNTGGMISAHGQQFDRHRMDSLVIEAHGN